MKKMTIMTSEGIKHTKSMNDEDVILQWQKNFPNAVPCLRIVLLMYNNVYILW